MRRPGPAVVLVGGLALFGLAAVAVIGWAFSGQGAGEERGLVFKNFGDEALVLTINNRQVELQPNQQQTVPVRASEFPQTLRVRDANGGEYQREFQFCEFQDYQFYVGLQDAQFATYMDPTLPTASSCGEQRELLFKNSGAESLVLTANDRDAQLEPDLKQTTPR